MMAKAFRGQFGGLLPIKSGSYWPIAAGHDYQDQVAFRARKPKTFPDVDLAAAPSARSNTALPDRVRSSDSQETTPHASFPSPRVFPLPALCDCNQNDFCLAQMTVPVACERSARQTRIAPYRTLTHICPPI